jgi:DNA polymerase-3 subunit alpha
MFIIFDTETTGLPRDWNGGIEDPTNWPRMVQIAWQLHDSGGKLVSANSLIVKPENYTIPYNAAKVHGITTERALAEGRPLWEVLDIFEADRSKATYAVGHNISFDINVIASENSRLAQAWPLMDMKQLDTKDLSTKYCAIPGGKGGGFKWPTLTELHTKLFGVPFQDAHDAAYDVDATARCFFALIQRNVFAVAEVGNPASIAYEAPVLGAANFRKNEPQEVQKEESTPSVHSDISAVKELPFAHLHCHSQFSILQCSSTVFDLVKKSKDYGMAAVALCDHGNMMAAFQFVKEALKSDITPIVGCEFNLCANHKDKSRQDNGYQTVLLAKNKAGYHNLAKLSSIGFTEGFYYVPRIDREVLGQYKSDLIATTGGLWGEVPYLILNVGETQAEAAFIWWKEQFGDDFYVELCRHGIEEENIVNNTLLKFAEKHNVKYFAANNTYYTEKKDARTHDLLLCVKDGVLVEKPRKYIGRLGKEYRYGFPEGNQEFYIKSAEEMKRLFADLPEAVTTVGEIIGKIERYKLEREVLLPKFDIPAEFLHAEDAADAGKRGENAYLRHLTYEGAKKRYPEISDEVKDRIDFELSVIANTGYPGYFLIVQDFCAEARSQGVWVGPGRGSAAGSVVAYCTGITNVDPIKYDLLFERFLNPDRVSLPDIDIDFDDEGRQKVIDYVIKKYGSNQVAQIITYGTMAAKSSVRDAGRVLGLPLGDTDRIAKLVPNAKLQKLFAMDDKALKEAFRDSEYTGAMELLKVAQGTGPEAEVVLQARAMEGSMRNTGIHACGVIITPGDITDFVPVATAKDSDMWCTQFDNSVVESAGLLKMDFLGLKTLTLIKDALEIVKERYGIEIDPDAIPLDDVKSYELFQRGETVGIFQYESPGMQLYMKDLKPTTFDDLIAMNALYRPGPIDYIPSFIKRKHGLEPITYDVPASEEYLKETYGITVYQEQVMLLSQKLAGFTKGEADVLRKAMGKKQRDVLDKMKPKFIEQAKTNGHPEAVLEKIWKDWEAFASYAFNKSHSTCYALIAFQTAYIKANYPAAYMASVLSNNMSDIKQVTFFMEECRRLGTPVLGPSVNESNLKFTVNDKNQIRFGLGAIKGVGEHAVRSIVAEREKAGEYKDIFDFVKRVDLRQVNKRVLESLVFAGAFDCFTNMHRAQYMEPVLGTTGSFIEHLIKWGGSVQTALDAPPDLFGNASSVEIQNPEPPFAERWGNLEQLTREKEVVGIYISAHPLDDFALEIKSFTTHNTDLRVLKEMENHIGRDLALAGMISTVEHRTTKTGKPFGSFELEDYHDSYKFMLFSEDYLRLKHMMIKGAFIFLRGKIGYRPWGDSKEPEFKIAQLELLNDLREKRTKKVNIEFRLHDLNDGFIKQFDDLLKTKKGSPSCPVSFRVIDTDEKWSIQMPSRSRKIDLSNETISQLDAMPGVKYSLIA